MTKSTLLLLPAVLLSACSLMEKKPPTVIHTITAKTEAAACAHPAAIKIAEPKVAPGLDTPRIAAVDTPGQLTYYKGVAWPDAAPQMLQHFLVDAFTQSKAFQSVSSDMDLVETPYLLLTDVHEFQVNTLETPHQVRLRLVSRLVQADTRKVLATIPVEMGLKVETPGMANYVGAFNTGMNATAKEILSAIQPLMPKCGKR